MSGHILYAYSLDGKGGGTPLTNEQVATEIKSKKLAWVHLDASQPETQTWVDEKLSYLDPFLKDALLANETRPRMAQIGDGVLINLRGVNLNENADPEDMVSIRLYIDKHRIISVRRRKLMAVTDLEAKLKDNKGPKDAGDFLCQLVEGLFKRMQPTLTQLDATTDDIEERILGHTDATLREEIVYVRQQAIIFRRYMAPQRDAISQLKTTDVSWLNQKHQRHLQESLNHVTRYVEDLEAIRERAQIIKDELANMLADKLNKNMYVLSLVAAIFLPLGFLTGLLGINVGGIPGADNPLAFGIFCGLLIIIVALQMLIFRKLKWL